MGSLLSRSLMCVVSSGWFVRSCSLARGRDPAGGHGPGVGPFGECGWEKIREDSTRPRRGGVAGPRVSGSDVGTTPPVGVRFRTVVTGSGGGERS